MSSQLSSSRGSAATTKSFKPIRRSTSCPPVVVASFKPVKRSNPCPAPFADYSNKRLKTTAEDPSLKQQDNKATTASPSKTGHTTTISAPRRGVKRRNASSTARLDTHTEFHNSSLPRDNKKRKVDLKITTEKPIHSSQEKDVFRLNSSSPLVRTLSVPGLSNDFYSNVVAWSRKDIVAIGLDDRVYLYNNQNGDTQSLAYDFKSEVSSMAFNITGVYLAVGTADGAIQIFKKMAFLKKLRLPQSGDSKVNALAWNPTGKMLLSAGTSDGHILHYSKALVADDVKPNLINVKAHKEDVCGLKWRKDGTALASSGADGYVRVWRVDALEKSIFQQKAHETAIKALAWCPWNFKLLASGGGLSDKMIKVWNVNTPGKPAEAMLDAQSQVTSLQWSTHYKILVATHGAPSNNITLWDYPSRKKICDIRAHDNRILHSVLNYSSRWILTVAADNKVKFWSLFTDKKKVLPEESLSQNACTSCCPRLPVASTMKASCSSCALSQVNDENYLL